MENIKTVTLDGIIYTVEFKPTHIGDIILTRDEGNTYEADITDADDLNWIVLEQRPETPSPDSSPAPNYYHRLKYLLGLMDQLVHWAAIDRESNSFSIVDRDWTIYRALNECYNNWHAQDLLKANGILISVADIEDNQAIYLITYTK